MSQSMEFPGKAGYLIAIFAVLYLAIAVLGALGYVDLSDLVGSLTGFLIVLLGVYLVVNVIVSFIRQESP